MKLTTFARAIVCVTCVLLGSLAHAAGFPERAITVLVPYTAGGSSDALARLLAKQLGDQFGQPVVVDNKPGAGATLGTALAAKAAPDGYTVLLADTAYTTAPALYQRLSYDAIKSFQPVGMVGTTPAMLFASRQSNLRSVQDMRSAAPTRPGGSFTSGIGSGTASQLISELYRIQSGLKIEMIPYKGSSQAVIDVLAGQIDLIFTSPASAGQYLKSDKLKAIAVTGAQRHRDYPEVRTFQEQGISGMDAGYWFAVLLPANVPTAISQRWEKELAAALVSAPVSKALSDLSITPGKLNAVQTQRFMTDDLANWARIVKAAGIERQ
ncbi:hypothetical protein PMI14_04602 [Acidovorax sp. CF316]|uniref:Bug family tripartite tricarboxylate transporter substrate binding protein n=1 Tax=Acidovorax sp. CF316 TaxID=1144317 RepID=UPI00026BCBB7|nr:tripartite tricarboxylate transporter substrate-binding protein [Acidovorax sp. CF316]EJE50740.1 hypothetical protein PMI14_04602 [Acidovorax sp. CF316]